MDLESQIKDAIASGNTEEALHKMDELSKIKNLDLSDEITILKGRLKKWQKEKNLGLNINDIELRQIQFAILQILKGETIIISNNKHEPKKVGHNILIHKLIKFTGFFLCVTGLIIFIFRFDIIHEFFKGTKNVNFIDLLTPFFLFLLGVILFLNSKR